MKTKSLLTLACFALITSILSAQEATIARLAGAESVTVTLPSGEDVMMGQGDVIPVGSWVEVSSGKLFLRTFQGTVSVFSSGSVFEVTEIDSSGGKEKTRLTLQSGDMVANLDPTKRDVNDYGVVTPKGVAAARGTNYTVSVNGQNVLVSVVAGEVSVLIPDVGLVNLSTGQVTSGGQATSLSAALSNAGTAAATRTALQAAASAVASLAASGTDGVNNDTLSTVISTASTAASDSGDDGLVALVAATATQANPSAAETIVSAAVAAAPTAATAVVASVTQEVTASSGNTETTNSVATRLVAQAKAANAAAEVEVDTVEAAVNEAQTGESTSTTDTTGNTTETVELEDNETVVEIEVPNDNVTQVQTEVFTIRLSGGRLLAVTVNDTDDAVIVVNTPVVLGAQTQQVGDGSRVVFDVPASVITALGRSLTSGQRANIEAGIANVLGDLPEIQVPNDTIIISPSS